MLTIGLDIGTSSVKGALVSFDGYDHKIVSSATEAVSYRPARLAPGTPAPSAP